MTGRRQRKKPSNISNPTPAVNEPSSLTLVAAPTLSTTESIESEATEQTEQTQSRHGDAKDILFYFGPKVPGQKRCCKLCKEEIDKLANMSDWQGPHWAYQPATSTTTLRQHLVREHLKQFEADGANNGWGPAFAKKSDTRIMISSASTINFEDLKSHLARFIVGNDQ
ncbi:hypothetical protein H0H92_014898, partial [Tricholoma furcatifolium]